MRAVSGTAFSAVTFLLPLTVAFPSSASSSFELSPRYDHSSLGEVAEDVGKTGWATLVAVHAVCGFVAFQVFMPLAVIFAAVGKSAFPDQWFKAHWQAQVFVVSPLAILAMSTYDYVPPRAEDEETAQVLRAAAVPAGRPFEDLRRRSEQEQAALPLPGAPSNPNSVVGFTSAAPSLPSLPPSSAPSPIPTSLLPTTSSPTPPPIPSASPRLSFMPFPGPNPIISPAPTYAPTLTPVSSLSSAHPRIDVEVHVPPPGEGESTSPATYVSAVTSVEEASRGGNMGGASVGGAEEMARRASLAGEVVGTQETKRDEAKPVVPPRPAGYSSPSPSSPSSTPSIALDLPSLSIRPEHNLDLPLLTPVLEDDESATLFDELERELTPSLSLSRGRTEESAMEKEEDEDDDAKTVASGAWLSRRT